VHHEDGASEHHHGPAALGALLVGLVQLVHHHFHREALLTRAMAALRLFLVRSLAWSGP
jgi:hypothetical protein